jgi:hypothetical protein
MPDTAQLPAVNAPVFDTVTNVVATFQEMRSGRYWLRPLGGGREWERNPEYVRQPTQDELIMARLRLRNRGHLG